VAEDGCTLGEPTVAGCPVSTRYDSAACTTKARADRILNGRQAAREALRTTRPDGQREPENRLLRSPQRIDR
jgi:hypothetical protein